MSSSGDVIREFNLSMGAVHRQLRVHDILIRIAFVTGFIAMTGIFLHGVMHHRHQDKVLQEVEAFVDIDGN